MDVIGLMTASEQAPKASISKFNNNNTDTASSFSSTLEQVKEKEAPETKKPVPKTDNKKDIEEKEKPEGNENTLNDKKEKITDKNSDEEKLDKNQDEELSQTETKNSLEYIALLALPSLQKNNETPTVIANTTGTNTSGISAEFELLSASTNKIATENINIQQEHASEDTAIGENKQEKTPILELSSSSSALKKENTVSLTTEQNNLPQPEKIQLTGLDKLFSKIEQPLGSSNQLVNSNLNVTPQGFNTSPYAEIKNTPTIQISTPVNQAQWGNMVADKIVWLNSNHLQGAELVLTPPELGSMHAKISLEHGNMEVVFTSASSQVRDALEAQLPRLKEVLQNENINLTNVFVSDQGPKNYSSHQNSSQNEIRVNDESDISMVSIVPSAPHSNKTIDYYA